MNVKSNVLNDKAFSMQAASIAPMLDTVNGTVIPNYPLYAVDSVGEKELSETEGGKYMGYLLAALGGPTKLQEARSLISSLYAAKVAESGGPDIDPSEIRSMLTTENVLDIMLHLDVLTPREEAETDGTENI